eukprot:2996363-Pleurochrysis_carterae.AAC.2
MSTRASTRVGFYYMPNLVCAEQADSLSQSQVQCTVKAYCQSNTSLMIEDQLAMLAPKRDSTLCIMPPNIPTFSTRFESIYTRDLLGGLRKEHISHEVVLDRRQASDRGHHSAHSRRA